jgi:hypothetical protein
VVARYAMEHGDIGAIEAFPDHFKNVNQHSALMQISRWKKCVREGKILPYVRPPAYGNIIDVELAEQFDIRRAAGLDVDDASLRRMLIPLLNKYGMSKLLKENGGKYCFNHSWAVRFFKRHNISTRVCTTKMRELPLDFDAKKAEYIKIGAKIIERYRIPPELVVGTDETNALFVNRAKKTRDRSGNKRVRVIGMGDDKAQVTVLFAANECGQMLDEYQIIWQGITARSHPPAETKQPGSIWSHSKSHWQNEKTYLDVLKNIAVPYRLRMITLLGLTEDQKMLWKHDLHFTHKDEAVMKFAAENHIIFLFVPAKCTDVLQECDVILNSPFKCSLKKEFRDWLHIEFTTYLANGNDSALFKPRLIMSVLKPLMPGWIHAAIQSLKTPIMAVAISECFKNDGCFGIMRSPAYIAGIREELDAEINPAAIIVPDGLEIEEDNIDDLVAGDDVLNDLDRFAAIALDFDDESDSEREDDDADADDDE